MTLAKRVERHIEIFFDGTVKTRDEIIIEEDGQELARVPRFKKFAPGDSSIDGESCARTKAVAAAVWTPETLAAYSAKIAKLNDGK